MKGALRATRKRSDDVPLRLRWPLIWLGAAVGAWVVAGLLARTPGAAEAYATDFGPLLTRPLSRFTGLVPVPVGELALYAYVGWIVVAVTRAVRAVAAGRRRLSNALYGGALRVARDGGVIAIAFFVLYGLNYARPSLETRVGWPDWDGVEVAELTAITESAAAAANRAYVELHGGVDAGEPTAVPENVRDVERSIDEGWRRAAAALNLPRSAAAPHGRVKWPWASEIVARFGIAGVYFPFTAEANVVRGMPALLTFQGMAHEKAHQRGIASEAEANFLGFAAGALATDPQARYAAAMFAQRQLSANLAVRDRDAWRRIDSTLHPGVKRDLADLNAYFRRYDGVTETVGRAVNNQFLRANRVPGGVRDYARSARLLIAWARVNGGDVLPARPGVEAAGGPGR